MRPFSASPDSPRPAARWKRGALWTLGVLVALPVALFAGLWLYALTLQADVPDLYRLRNPSLSFSSIAYTSDGAELARYHAENRTWVPFEAISPAAVHALVTTEDVRFYQHKGIDYRRLLSSAFKTMRGDTQGGSTLTMQLARNLFPEVGKEQSISRKLREMITARRLEKAYSKEDILEMYLNTVAFNYNAFGIEAAAQVYFGKSARVLGPAEAALLVGMLQAPTAYNPVQRPEAARQRRNIVLSLMALRGHLSPQQATRLQAQPLGLDFSIPTPERSLAPHFAAFVREWTEQWASKHNYDIDRDGLRIYTTLDSRVQALAAEAVAEKADGLQAVADYEWSRASPGTLSSRLSDYERARRDGRFAPFSYFWRSRQSIVDTYVRESSRYQALRGEGAEDSDALRALRSDGAFMDSLRSIKTRLDAGLVAIEPQTGYVRAWVGGRDYAQDRFDKVGQARRQPGSTFKPFVYAAAIDWGYSPDDLVEDRVRSYATGHGNERWTPTNAGGGASGATITLRDGLVYSKNTISAFLINEVGPGYVARVARKMGIVSTLREVPSLALGTSEVTLLELSGAYTTLANNGTRRLPIVVTRIESRDGEVLARFEAPESYSLSGSTSYTVLDMMRGVVDRGTGAAIRSQYNIQGDLAGKTGTTQNNADGWFMLMHPQLVTGAWVGFSDRRIAFRTSYWGQGGHNALHLVGAFLSRVQRSNALDLRADIRFEPPPGYTPPAARAEPWWATDSLYSDPYVDVFADSLSPLPLREVRSEDPPRGEGAPRDDARPRPPTPPAPLLRPDAAPLPDAGTQPPRTQPPRTLPPARSGDNGA